MMWGRVVTFTGRDMQNAYTREIPYTEQVYQGPIGK